MRILLFNHFQNAYQSLRSTRMRTSLTMLGVGIGVASVTAILSLSSGATRIIADQVDELGGNIAVVRPGIESDQLERLTTPNPYQSYATSTLSEKDVRTISELPSVQAAAPLMIVKNTLRGANDSSADTALVATTPELVDIAGLTVGDGQFIDTVTNKDTAVIGNQLSIDLFGTDQSIGKTFTVKDSRFTIIGVLSRNENPINFNTVDFDRSAIVSLENGKRFNQGTTQIQQINIQAKSVDQLPSAISQARQALQENHQGEQDFMILSGREIATPTSQLFTIVTSATTVVAIITLIVGGVGIMNIMLVSVAERTREIGIRKALGATNAHVIAQFLIEALAMSLGGAILGYFLGYIVAFAVSTLLPFAPVFTWQIAVTAVGIAIVIGTLFGLYPAIRAARKDPIESLRHYN